MLGHGVWYAGTAMHLCSSKPMLSGTGILRGQSKVCISLESGGSLSFSVMIQCIINIFNPRHFRFSSIPIYHHLATLEVKFGAIAVDEKGSND